MYKILGSDQKEYGPISGEQLRQWITEGRVNATTLAQSETVPGWKPISNFPEFSTTVASAGPVSPAAAPSVSRTNPMAITGLIMGICSLTLGLCCYGFPFNILGIVFSCIGLAQIKKNPEIEKGRGLALTGLILSILAIVLIVLLVVLGVALNFQDIMKDLKK